MIKISSHEPPYQYFDENGEPAGADVDWIRAAAEMGGIERELVFAPRGGEMPAELDGGRMFSMESELEYCLPHRVLELGVFLPRDSLVRELADLRGKRVAVVAGSFGASYLVRHGFRDGLAKATTASGAIDLLARGEVEAVVMESQQGLWALAESGRSGIILGKNPVCQMAYGFAVSAGEAPLRASLERGMAVIQRTGQYDRIAAAHLSSTEAGLNTGSSVFSLLYSYAVWVLVPLIFLVVLALAQLAGRRRTVEGRIAELEKELEELRRRDDVRRSERARERFVINRMSTVSLVDQLLSVSRSKNEEQPTELRV
ncbi:MAG: transporter substrate-binding domain-containing protein [Verrucomicrobiota bacterium]